MVSAMFRQTDYILPSYAEASLITGETEIRRIIEALQDMGAANIVLKLGGKGCYLHANGIDKMIEAYPARVVDTTGAGIVLQQDLSMGWQKAWMWKYAPGWAAQPVLLRLRQSVQIPR